MNRKTFLYSTFQFLIFFIYLLVSEGNTINAFVGACLGFSFFKVLTVVSSKFNVRARLISKFKDSEFMKHTKFHEELESLSHES